MENTQISLFDLVPQEIETSSGGPLTVVKAQFKNSENLNWHNLFDGFDELYGITFSSGIQFMEKVFSSFKHVEIIFGCEGVLNSDISTIMASQIINIEKIVKSKSAAKIADRIKDGSIDIRVSRDTKSHEKIFILKSEDGRTRVICGSANMSASAFLGIQRENIVYFDDQEAFDYYKEHFDNFKDKCSDTLSEKVIAAIQEDDDYIRDNIQEVPILQTIKKNDVVVLEPTSADTDDVEIVASINGLEAEIKPLIPKIKPEKGKILITSDKIKTFKKKYDEQLDIKKVRAKQLPKLHIDYDNKKLLFNDKEFNLNPEKEAIQKDISSLFNFIDSLSTFYGDYKKSQNDYYRFLNWYFCSPFMPYLRYIGSKHDYGVFLFPVFGILYGESNGGKTTFIKLLSKMMTGAKVNLNTSEDFTATRINGLKSVCEGLPINIDDLAKDKYSHNNETVIKMDDNWGILERKFNYPSIAITTNRIPALTSDISKRVVSCRIDIKIDKETGAYNAKKINESMKYATNAFYCEYVRRMFDVINQMEESMKKGEEKYFPDILKESSNVIISILKDLNIEIPEYVKELSYSDYFGNMITGRYAINKIKTAWETEPDMFEIDKKKNRLIYRVPEKSNYELKNLQDELPPMLEIERTGTRLVMKLDKANEVFGVNFKKGFFSSLIPKKSVG